MTSSLKANEDPVSERKKLYISEREIPALFEVKFSEDKIHIEQTLLGIDVWFNEP